MADNRDEFHDGAIPVVGSCTAGRVWKVEPDGILRGVTYGQPWTATGNTAICPYIGVPRDERPHPPETWRNHGWYPTFFYPHGGGKSRDKPHKPGAMGCSCGYWVYHDLTLSATWASTANLHRAPYVVGLVHAYGNMTRGSKGYRAEHADIAALITPGWAGDDLWEKVATLYPVPCFDTIEAAATAVRSAA